MILLMIALAILLMVLLQAFFYKQHLRLNLCLENYSHFSFKNNILKNKQKNKAVYIHELVRLIILNMKIKMKNRSHSYKIKRPRSRHGHKYNTYKVSHYDDAYIDF